MVITVKGSIGFTAVQEALTELDPETINPTVVFNQPQNPSCQQLGGQQGHCMQPLSCEQAPS